MSSQLDPLKGVARPYPLSTIVLSVAQGMSFLGCVAAPFLTAHLLGRVGELARQKTISDKAAWEFWTVFAGLVLFCMGAGLAVVFKQAKAVSLLLQQPGDQPLPAGADRRPIGLAEPSRRGGGVEWLYMGFVAGLGGLAIDCLAGTGGVFAFLGFLSGFFLAPVIWGVILGVAEAENEREQEND